MFHLVLFLVGNAPVVLPETYKTVQECQAIATDNANLTINGPGGDTIPISSVCVKVK